MTLHTNAPADEQAAALAELLAGIDVPAATPPPPAARDGRGRFLPGNPGGPGRPRGQGLDYRALAEREAERDGIDLPRAMWRVLQKLIELAHAGDVAAAKLVLDKLGIVEDAQHAGVQLVVVTGVDPSGQPAQGIALKVTSNDRSSS